jgi:hypothetical protein
MQESEYRALYELLRVRALNENPGVAPVWFIDIKDQLDAISRMVAEDRTLSRAAKRRLANKGHSCDEDCYQQCLHSVHGCHGRRSE